MIILIALLIGTAAGLLQAFCKGWRAVVPDEKEEGAGACESAWMLPIMQEAFRRAAPNSRGRGSRDYMNLSTIIQKLEAGEDVAPGVCSYLLEKIGAGDLAEQIRGAGA